MMLFKMFLQVLKGRNIKGLDKVAGQSHVFEMQTGSEKKMYGGSESEVNSWVSDINKNLPVDNSSATPLCNRAPLTDICNNTVTTVLQPDQEMTTYTVVLGKCPEENSNTALCLEKQYKLCLDTHEMVLIQAQGPSHQQLVKWPYRYIRRYGRSTHRFTFEAGRKCESGEGLFEFEVEDGEEVFADVSNRTRAMKKHKKQGSEGSIPHLETSPLSSGTSSSRALPATPTSPLQPPIPERKYGTDTINEVKLQQMKRNGTSPPQTPDKTHPNKVVHAMHAIKEQTKHVLEHLTDSLHHTHNNEKKLKSSSEDVRKRNSGLTVESEVLGTTGKYSPNMQHRSLPAIPKDAPTQPPVKNTHEYALYDDTYKRRGVTPSGGDLYEGDQPSSYMMAQSSLSDYKSTDLYDDDQEHYSSIEEQDRLKLLNKNTMNSVQSETRNTTVTFKMSSVLAETRQANENSAATDQDYDDVDGMIPTEETYSYTYAGEYDIVDFRKDLEMKSAGTDTPFFSSATDGDNVYGSVSLNHANYQSDSPSYINTSHMKSLKS